VTIGRLDEWDLPNKKLTRLHQIWSTCEFGEVKEEVHRVGLKIGEISFTLRLLSLFVPEAQRIVQAGQKKVNLLEYYFEMAAAREKAEEMYLVNLKDQAGLVSKKKKKKAVTKSPVETLNKSRSSLFYKLKYLAVILFSEGQHTHINVTRFMHCVDRRLDIEDHTGFANERVLGASGGHGERDVPHALLLPGGGQVHTLCGAAEGDLLHLAPGHKLQANILVGRAGRVQDQLH
jgi:hypothetical protein